MSLFGSFDDATVSSAALLSNAAWLNAQGAGGSDLSKYLQTIGWTLVGTYSKNNASAFAAVKGDSLAISIRGVVNEQDKQGIVAAAYNPLSTYSDLLPFINKEIKYANQPSNQNIKKILITGASGGGELAELYAANPPMNITAPVLDQFRYLVLSLKSAAFTLPQREGLGRFTPGDVSIVTFGSTGIPSYANTNSSSLQDRVLSIHNSGDAIYTHTGDVAGFSLPIVLGNLVHLGTQVTIYTPFMQFAHSPTLYKDEIQALIPSTLQNVLSSQAGSQTTVVFGGTDTAPESSNEIVTVNSTSLGLPKGPYFLVTLGGTDTLRGSTGNDLIEAYTGNHVLTGGGGADQYEIFSGNDTITDFDYNNDRLSLPATSVSGKLINGDTMLNYTGTDNKPGTVSLKGVDLGPVASQYSWLHWTGA